MYDLYSLIAAAVEDLTPWSIVGDAVEDSGGDEALVRWVRQGFRLNIRSGWWIVECGPYAKILCRFDTPAWVMEEDKDSAVKALVIMVEYYIANKYRVEP